jgi:acetyltransferase-like isoleucine patch superfamily enzyme
LNKIRRIVNKSSKPEEIFKSIGQNVQISDMESLHNKENIVIGNNVYIGGGCLYLGNWRIRNR